MKRIVLKNQLLQSFDVLALGGDINNTIKMLVEIRDKWKEKNFTDIVIEAYDDLTIEIRGTQKESDAAYKKRLAAQEEKERKQYEKLKKKFEVKNRD